jgi:hypothetical protein
MAFAIQLSPANFRIQSNVQSLQPELWMDCKSLRLIAFENSLRLEPLSMRGFKGSGLISISLPSSVKVMELECFQD